MPPRPKPPGGRGPETPHGGQDTAGGGAGKGEEGWLGRLAEKRPQRIVGSHFPLRSIKIPKNYFGKAIFFQKTTDATVAGFGIIGGGVDLLCGHQRDPANQAVLLQPPPPLGKRVTSCRHLKGVLRLYSIEPAVP